MFLTENNYYMKAFILKNKPIYILFLLFLMSCEKKVYLKIPDTELPYVLNCVFSPDSAWAVQIYKTISIYNPYNFDFQKDLKPEIYENGTKSGELSYYSKQTDTNIFEYFSNSVLTINENNEYSIKVPVNNIIISATSKIPGKPDVTDITISNFNLTNFYNLENADYGYSIEGNIQIVIKNKPEIKYYAIVIYYFADYILAWPITQILPTKNSLDYTLYGEFDEFKTYAGKEGHIYKCDNSQQNDTLLIAIDDYAKVTFRDFNTIYIEVKSITEDYYLYQKSVKDQAYSRNDPFAEPVPIYTNIQNGIGIFTAYNSLVDTIYLE